MRRQIYDTRNPHRTVPNIRPLTSRYLVGFPLDSTSTGSNGRDHTIGWLLKAAAKSKRSRANSASLIPHPGHGTWKKYRKTQGSRNRSIPQYKANISTASIKDCLDHLIR